MTFQKNLNTLRYVIWYFQEANYLQENLTRSLEVFNSFYKTYCENEAFETKFMGNIDDAPNAALLFTWLHRSPIILWVLWCDPITRSCYEHEKIQVKLRYGKNLTMDRITNRIWFMPEGSKIGVDVCTAFFTWREFCIRKNGRKADLFNMDEIWSDCDVFVRLAGLESNVFPLKCWSLTSFSTWLELLFISRCWLMESEKKQF